MSAEDDLARFGVMDAQTLIERLKAAEDVCVMYGWTGVRHYSPREKALSVLWGRWYRLAGKNASEPEHNPHLDDATIQRLADQFDDHRQREMEKLEKLVVVERGDDS